MSSSSPHVDERLTDFVLGALAPDGEADVRAHLDRCEDCSRSLRVLRAGSARLVEAGPRATPSAEASGRLLRDIRGADRFSDLIPALAALYDVSHHAARGLVDGLGDTSNWMEGPVPGVLLYPVETGPKFPGAFAGFVRMAPGQSFPAHRHDGEEWNLVLQGGMREVGTDVEVWPGEQLHKTVGSEHAYAAIDGPDCIVASVVLGFIEFLPSDDESGAAN